MQLAICNISLSLALLLSLLSCLFNCLLGDSDKPQSLFKGQTMITVELGSNYATGTAFWMRNTGFLYLQFISEYMERL